MANPDETLPPKSGEWVTRQQIAVICPACHESMLDIPMVWWDASGSGWRAYLTCNVCGADSYGIDVTEEVVSEWGRAGGGWEEVLVDPEDR